MRLVPLIRDLPVLRNVESYVLVVLGNAKRHKGTDYLKNYERRTGRVQRDDDDGKCLHRKLVRVAVKQPIGTRRVDGHRCKESGCQRAERAADPMHGENVKRVVNAT